MKLTTKPIKRFSVSIDIETTDSLVLELIAQNPSDVALARTKQNCNGANTIILSVQRTGNHLTSANPQGQTGTSNMPPTVWESQTPASAYIDYHLMLPK